jgi:hypothetical protein
MAIKKCRKRVEFIKKQHINTTGYKMIKGGFCRLAQPIVQSEQGENLFLVRPKSITANPRKDRNAHHVHNRLQRPPAV